MKDKPEIAEDEPTREDSLTADAPPQVGEIVQANENARNWFRCLVVVSEIKSWGIQGFTTIPHPDRDQSGDAYIRLQWEEIERTGGHSRFITEDMKDAIERSQRSDQPVVSAAKGDVQTDGNAIGDPTAESS
jgi:hypothetical protein